jgi:transcription antitermination factor NusG
MTVAAHQVLDPQAHRRLKPPPEDTGHADNAARTPSGSRPGPRWFVVSSYAQAERRAAQALTRQGYEAYLPTLIVQRRDRVIRSMLHRVEAPLFPSYLFIRLDLRDPWGPVRNTPGVFRLLTTADNIPEPVSETVIDALRAGDAFRRLPTTDDIVYRPGAPVKCLYGPFQGQEAVIVSVAATTARVALPMLGALRELVVPIACLTARD